MSLFLALCEINSAATVYGMRGKTQEFKYKIKKESKNKNKIKKCLGKTARLYHPFYIVF